MPSSAVLMTSYNFSAQTSNPTPPTSFSSRPPPQPQASVTLSDPFNNNNKNNINDYVLQAPSSVLCRPFSNSPPHDAVVPASYPDYKHDLASRSHYHHPSHEFRRQTSPPYHYGTSVSSAGGSSGSESVDLEKGAYVRGGESQLNISRVSVAPVDLGAEVMSEKSTGGREREEYYHPTVAGGGIAPFERGSTDVEEQRELEAKAMKLLLFLSGPCTFLSLAISIYTLLAIILTLLLSPLQLCFRRRPSPSTYLISLVGPSLTLQLRCIYSPIVSTTTSSESRQPQYSLSKTLLVHALSPLLSLGVALAAWVVGLYWVLAAMVGNPDGLDGRNDGRETVAGLRMWWEGWLVRAVVSGGGEA